MAVQITTPDQAYDTLCKKANAMTGTPDHAKMIEFIQAAGYGTLGDHHLISTDDDTAKIEFYRKCMKILLAPEIAARKAAAATPGDVPALFTELCKLLRANPSANKPIAAHVRAVTNKTIGLGIYNTDTSFSDADKAALYGECISALKSKDFSKLKGESGKGDRRVEVEEETAAQATTPEPPTVNEEKVAPPIRTVKFTEGPPIERESTDEEPEEDDPMAAAMEMLKRAMKQPKPKVQAFDESVAQRMVDASIGRMAGKWDAALDDLTKRTAPDYIKGIMDAALNNGHFPTKRVEDLIASALKTAAPSFDVDSIVTPRIDALLGGKLSDFLKMGPSALTASTKPKLEEEGGLASTIPDEDSTYVLTKDLKALFKFVRERAKTEPQNLIATGPHGCGKTSLAYAFAAAFKMPILVMDCANLREPRDWFGYKYTVDGDVRWHRAQFDRCLGAGGHVIVLDELTRCTDQIRNVLNPLLDHRRTTYLEERGDFITVGDNTIIFATVNEGMAFTGCSVLDLALDDRMTARLEVNYLPKHQEADLLVKRTGIDPGDAMKLAEIAESVRAKNVGLGATLTKTITTRQLVEAASFYKGIGLDGLTFTISNHFNSEGGESSERAQILQMLAMKFPKSR